MAKFIKLRRYHDNETILVNVDDISKVKPAGRGTATVQMKSGGGDHVLESTDEIHKKMTE